MKRCTLALICVLLMQCSSAPTTIPGNWDVYITEYESGPASITVNMELVHHAPITELPYLLVTSGRYENCRPDGFPEEMEMEELYRLTAETTDLLSGFTSFQMSGSFTHQCQRQEYYYVRDTLGIRAKLTAFYQSKYPGYAHHIDIRPDEDWTTYFGQLFPDEETREGMANQKVLMQLQSAGDDLSQPRQVDHWLYFPDADSREVFVIKYVEPAGFNIEHRHTLEDGEMPYQLVISRVDKVDPISIDSVTLDLRRKALKVHGEYDGWETIVVK